MAVNSSRNQSLELLEGSTDGKYRKVRPDTAVVPGAGDEIVRENRESLHTWLYDNITQEVPPAQRVSPGA